MISGMALVIGMVPIKEYGIALLLQRLTASSSLQAVVVFGKSQWKYGSFTSTSLQ